MGRAHNRNAAVSRANTRFRSVLGSSRGAYRPYDALITGEPREQALTEVAQLVKQFHAGNRAPAIKALVLASGQYNPYILSLADDVAVSYAEYGPGVWEETAAAALYAFSFFPTDFAGFPRLDAKAMGKWETECYEGLSADIEVRMKNRDPLSESIIEAQADSICRGGLVWAVADMCDRADAAHLRQMLLLTGLKTFYDELDKRFTSSRAREIVTAFRALLESDSDALFSTLVPTLGVVDWAEIVERWVTQSPIASAHKLIQDTPYFSKSKEQLGDEVAKALVTALGRGYPRD
jgi:hypothetical protein